MSISNLRTQAQNHTWFAFLLRSIVTLLFTLALMIWHPISMQSLLYLFSMYILVDSSITIITGLLYRRGDWMIFGIIASLIGCYGMYPPRRAGILLSGADHRLDLPARYL
jgi:uncharacterized membrane protein HdeD (DUF308 family)